jgi:glycosyltransferase Alg8
MHTEELDQLTRPGPLRAALDSLPATLFYLAFAAAIIAALPDRAWNLKTQALVAMSLFGLWRYSWQGVHLVRHWRYRRTVFPALRARAMSREDKYPRRLYVMVPSYREEFKVSQLVFAALIREAQTVPSRVLIYASVGSDEEVEFISKVINATPGGEDVEVVFMRQEQGKRVAMGHALRAIARDFNDPLSWHPDTDNDAVIFMDGDTLVEPGMFRKTLPYFRANPKLGALTTDNLGVSPAASGLFNDWYTVKFAQRNHLFHSHSLSRRVLTVTGRFSIYRASVVVNEEFIGFLEADHLDHWLFGRFRFLMGDDKSTWFYLLKEGMEMLYVPDALAVALEMRQTNFFRTSLSLMHRWYGNMLRNNWRAVRLGPRPMGFFIWWCVLDQRFSSFTPLVGPVSILLLGIFDSWFYVAFYVAWVIVTRLTMMWVYVLEGMVLRISHIPLMLYNQWIGALLKIYSMYSLSVQSWQKSGDEVQREGARQTFSEDGTDGGVPVSPGQGQTVEGNGLGFFRNTVRAVLLTLNIFMLVAVCGVVSGAFALPGLSEYAYYTARLGDGPLPDAAIRRIEAVQSGVAAGTDQDSAAIINDIIDSVTPGQRAEIVLPPGRLMLDSPLRLNRDSITLRGAGRGVTVLVSRMDGAAGEAAVLVGGQRGEQVATLGEGARRGDKALSVAAWPEDAAYVWLGAPNDDDFLNSIGDRHWRGDQPWIRQYIARVSGGGAGYLVLARGLPVDMPPGTRVRVARMVTDVTLADFTLVQDVPGRDLAEATGVYENLAPDHAVDGIRFDWAAQCRVEDVAVIGAGRHPLVFENSVDVTARRLEIDGAWNKGKGGNGYVRFARSHGCVLADSVVRNVRHLAFQWSATGNEVRASRLSTDVNFHGGYSQDNRVIGCEIVPPQGHPWGQVTRMPEGGGAWAPPDGPGNEIVP